ncbi:hypothetical protein M406DRAFT_239998, partial [Cryphonectria parasitica EP155]
RLVLGASRAGSRRPQASTAADGDELPPYESPEFPLDAAGQKQLSDLANGQLNTKLNTHAKRSAELLASTVWAINDGVTSQRKQVAQARARYARRRRRANGESHDDEDDEDDAQVDELDRVVAPLTLEVEEAMREVLDIQAALQDEKEVLGNLPELVFSAQEARAQEVQEAEDAQEPEVRVASLVELYELERRRKADEYEKLGAYAKYASNNAYIDFKRQWHEGLYADDDIPVPNPHTWFEGDGRPHVGLDLGGQQDDSDADIKIAREKRSFRCPLSLVTMSEPYTCRKCNHSFQKEAIMSFIKGGNRRGISKPCPETGCSITLDDLYYDEPLLRKIKRAAEMEREDE